MTRTTTLRAALLDEPLELAIDQPHQIFISVGSVAMMAGFASSSGVVDPLAGLVIAIGIEWAWLRGVASDRAKPSSWGVALNYSAFFLAASWGVLWCLKLLGVMKPEEWGWLLAFMHVVPLVWVSLCSAMTHRVKVQFDYAEQRRIQEEFEKIEQKKREQELELERERARKLQEIELWEKGQEAMQRVHAHASAYAPNAASPLPKASNAEPRLHQCACGAPLTVKQYAAMKRWGHCNSCKGKHV